MRQVNHGFVLVVYDGLTYFVFFGQAYQYDVDWSVLLNGFGAAVDPATFMFIYGFLR